MALSISFRIYSYKGIALCIGELMYWRKYQFTLLIPNIFAYNHQIASASDKCIIGNPAIIVCKIYIMKMLTACKGAACNFFYRVRDNNISGCYTGKGFLFNQKSYFAPMRIIFRYAEIRENCPADPCSSKNDTVSYMNAFRNVLKPELRWKSGLRLWLLRSLCNSQLLRTRESSSTKPNLQHN